MTIKAYRTTRYNAGRLPRQHKPQPRRSGSFWGVTWTAEDFQDEDRDETPVRHDGRR
jgi:hypothetical protein